MSKWHGGKGSKQRPTDQKKFSENWDKIFGNSLDNRYEPIVDSCQECGMQGFHKMDCSKNYEKSH